MNLRPKAAARVKRIHDLGFVRVCALHGLLASGGLFALCFIALSYLSSGSDPFSAYGVDPLRFIIGALIFGLFLGVVIWFVNEFTYRRAFRNGSAL